MAGMIGNLAQVPSEPPSPATLHTPNVFSKGKIKSDRSEAGTRRNMRSNKGFCGGWKGKKKMKWLLRRDVPSNKITPLYLPKQHMFLWSGRGLRHGQRQVREWQFFLQERFPDTLLQTWRTAIFLKTRNYFSNKLSGTLEAWLWWCASARCRWKVCSIKLEQQGNS